MENISCMRFKYLCEFLTGIEETYTDKNDKSFRISRSARNKLSTLRLCKIDGAKTVKATYNPSLQRRGLDRFGLRLRFRLGGYEGNF